MSLPGILRTAPALALVATALAGCQLFTGPLEKVEFSAERVETDVADSSTAEVVLEVNNHGTETVVVPFCGDRLLASLEAVASGEGWEMVTSGICPANLRRSELLEGSESVSSIYLLNLRGTFRFNLEIREEQGSESKLLTSSVIEIQG